MERVLSKEMMKMTKGHHQPGEHWNRFKGNVGETSERRGGAHMGFSERIDTNLNGTDDNDDDDDSNVDCVIVCTKLSILPVHFEPLLLISLLLSDFSILVYIKKIF